MANVTLKIDGLDFDYPITDESFEIIANFDNEGQEAAISLSRITLPNETAQYLRNKIAGGLTGGPGIFEGVPCQFFVEDQSGNEQVFDGYIDMTEEYFQIHPGKVEVKIKDDKTTTAFQDRANAVIFSGLVEEGLITSADYVNVEYVVERKNNPVELVIISVVLYLMVKELAEQIKEIQKDAAQVIAIATGSVTGTPASIALAIAQVLIRAAYIAIIIIAIIELIQDMIANFISPVRIHRAILFTTLLEKGCEKLGYKFNTPIKELQIPFGLTLLPSRPDEEIPIQRGIPKAGDFGFNLGEVFTVCRNMFHAKEDINGTDITLRSFNDPYWRRTSTYVIPSHIRIEDEKRYNTDEFRANTLIRFETDPLDDWTVNNFKGTNYEVIRNPTTVAKKELVLLKGIDEVRIPYALGNRKDGLNEVETALLGLASFADFIVNTFGGNSNLAGSIQARVGMLKISHDVHSVAKALVVQNGRLPVDHRDQFKAKVLYDSYHIEKSFVANNYAKQESKYVDIKHEFGLENYKETIVNNLATTIDGRQARLRAVKWNPIKDRAITNFSIQEVYTKNLVETFIEPE